MRRVGLFYRPEHSDAARKSVELEACFRRHEVDVWRGCVSEEEVLCEVARELDVLVTLGGDGTIVRAVRCVAPAGVPILGVNYGRLGFLAEVEPANALGCVPRLLEGKFYLERRMMLHTALLREGQTVLEAEGINDVAVGRGRGSRTVQVAVDVDGHYVMTQTADAMIVASPTGSTAYSLSAGGPIVTPGMRCIVITPVAAHLRAVAHSLVVPGESCVSIRLAKGNGATLTVDGQLDADVHVGDEVRTSVSQTTAGFVRFGSQGCFYETVFRKLRWPEHGSDG